jgi:hypothetical protein
MSRGNDDDDDEYITLDDDTDSVYDYYNKIMIVSFTDQQMFFVLEQRINRSRPYITSLITV